MIILKGCFTNYVKVDIVGLVGLDTRRHSRRIRHPLTMKNVGYPAPNFIHYPRVSVSRIREQDSEPSGFDRECSRPLRCPTWRIVLRLAFRLHKLICRSYHTMIYTFIIANKNKLAELNTSRKISVCAKTEQQARLSLKGLPLLFVSQKGRAL